MGDERVAPAFRRGERWTLRFQEPVGGFGERRHLRLALRLQRVAAFPRQLPVGESLVSRFGQRGQRIAAKPDVMAPAVDGESLNPRFRSARRDGQVERLAIAVQARRCDRLRFLSGELRHVSRSSPHVLTIVLLGNIWE